MNKEHGMLNRGLRRRYLRQPSTRKLNIEQGTRNNEQGTGNNEQGTGYIE